MLTCICHCGQLQNGGAYVWKIWSPGPLSSQKCSKEEFMNHMSLWFLQHVFLSLLISLFLRTDSVILHQVDFLVRNLFVHSMLSSKFSVDCLTASKQSASLVNCKIFSIVNGTIKRRSCLSNTGDWELRWAMGGSGFDVLCIGASNVSCCGLVRVHTWSVLLMKSYLVVYLASSTEQWAMTSKISLCRSLLNLVTYPIWASKMSSLYSWFC